MKKQYYSAFLAQQQQWPGVRTVWAGEPSTTSCASLRPACDCARSRVCKHAPDPNFTVTANMIYGCHSQINPSHKYVALSHMPATWLRGPVHR